HVAVRDKVCECAPRRCRVVYAQLSFPARVLGVEPWTRQRDIDPRPKESSSVSDNPQPDIHVGGEDVTTACTMSVGRHQQRETATPDRLLTVVCLRLSAPHVTGRPCRAAHYRPAGWL